MAQSMADALAEARSDVTGPPRHCLRLERVSTLGPLRRHALNGHPVLAAVLTELIRSARSSFAGVVVVSGHGGNAAASPGPARWPSTRVTRSVSGRPRCPGPTRTPGVPRLHPARHRPGAGARRARRARLDRAHHLDHGSSCDLRVCVRCRRTACSAIRRERQPRRAGACSPPWWPTCAGPSSSGGARLTAGHAMSRVAVVTGAARGIGQPQSTSWWQRLEGGGRRRVRQ